MMITIMKCINTNIKRGGKTSKTKTQTLNFDPSSLFRTILVQMIQTEEY